MKFDGFGGNLSILGPPSVRGISGSLNPGRSAILDPLGLAVAQRGLRRAAEFQLWGSLSQFPVRPERVMVAAAVMAPSTPRPRSPRVSA